MIKPNKNLLETEQRDQLLKMLEWLLAEVGDAPIARGIRFICNVRVVYPESI
jgi:hypothetical protein